MIPEEREIISEDYADLIIEYNGDFSVFEQFPIGSFKSLIYNTPLSMYPERLAL